MARRGGTRYLRVLRESDEPARNRLIQYFKGEVTPTYPERRKARPDQVAVWVTPFGIPFPTGYGLRQTVAEVRFDEVAPFFSGFTFIQAPVISRRVVLPGLLTCRAAVTTDRRASGIAKNSQLTGRKYKDYGGNGVVVPFGAATDPDFQTEEAVFRRIFERVKEANERNQCSFIPGSYSVG